MLHASPCQVSTGAGERLLALLVNERVQQRETSPSFLRFFKSILMVEQPCLALLAVIANS
jgi:hypothetical protein